MFSILAMKEYGKKSSEIKIIFGTWTITVLHIKKKCVENLYS